MGCVTREWEGLTMWVRGTEILLAAWLLFSPLVLASEAANTAWADAILAIAIIGCAAASFSPQWSHAYLVNLYVGIGLILWGRFANAPDLINQNHIVLGFLFLGLGLIPSRDEAMNSGGRSFGASTDERASTQSAAAWFTRRGWGSRLARHG